MDVNLSSDGDTSVLTLAGELDLSTTADLSGAAADALSRPECRRLVLDLSQLRFIDSSGINALIEVRAATRRAGAALHISRLSPRAAEVLRLTAVDQLFDIADT